MNEKGLGKRVQVARQSAGLTQQALCNKADLSYSTLAKIERGAIKAPSIFTIETIAIALGISLDELIGRVPSYSKIKQRLHSKSGVSFVYFDVNGCLVRSYHRAFSQLAHDSGKTDDAVETTFWHFNDQVCRGDMGLNEFNRELAAQLEMSTVDWSDYYLKSIEPMPHMNELVKWVAERYGVGLLTSIMPGILDSLMTHRLLPDVKYDTVVDSSVVRAIKPEKKIFEVAIQKADCSPEDILIVDDSRAILMAAERLGMKVFWFDDSRPEESVKRLRQALEPASNENSESYLDNETTTDENWQVHQEFMNRNGEIPART